MTFDYYMPNFPCDHVKKEMGRSFILLTRPCTLIRREGCTIAWHVLPITFMIQCAYLLWVFELNHVGVSAYKCVKTHSGHLCRLMEHDSITRSHFLYSKVIYSASFVVCSLLLDHFPKPFLRLAISAIPQLVMNIFDEWFALRGVKSGSPRERQNSLG